MLCALIVLGLLGLGKEPTSWSGNPLATILRIAAVQLQVAVAVAFTEGEVLKTLLL
jgi:hypothetical protein